MGEKESLDPGKCRARAVVCLLNQRKLFALTLIETALHAVRLAQTFKRKNEDLGVVLVADRRERNRLVLAALQPVDRCREDSNTLLGANVGSVLEVVVLTLLLGLQPETCEATEVLLCDGLVDSGTSPDTLAVVVRNTDPPVGLALDVTKDNILDWLGQARYLPWDVALPATPCFAQVLQHCVDLILLDTLRHHVHEISHNGSTKLQVEVRLDSLLGDSLRHALTVAALELSAQ